VRRAVFALLLAACSGERFSVEITLSARALGGDVARIHALDFDVSGGDRAHEEYPDLARAFQGGEERVVFLPVKNARGAVTISVEAHDRDGTPVATGQGTLTLKPGAAVRMRIELQPAPPAPGAGDLAGMVSTALDGGGDASAAVQLAFDRAQYHFGTVVAGDHSAEVGFTLANGGSASSGALALSLGGSSAFTQVSSSCDGVALNPGASCSVTFSYRPTKAGSDAATLSVTGASGGSATLALAGDALAPGDLRLTPSMLQLPTVVAGELGADQRFDVSNAGGAATGPLAIVLSGSDAASFELVSDLCSGVALAAAGTCSVSARFHPATAGAKSASLTVMATPGGAAAASLSGTALAPAMLGASVSTRDFGAIAPGTQSAALPVQITNSGMAPSALPSVAITGADAGEFVVTNNGCTAPLQPSASCAISIAFAPLVSGARSASLEVSASAGGKVTIALSGTGVRPAQLALSPTSPPAFADVVAGGVGGTQTFQLTNSGEASSALLATTLSDSTNFAVVSDGCAGLHLGGAANCAVQVQFRPQTSGAKSATLTVGGQSASLSGKGLVPAQLSITPTSDNFGSVVINTDSADVPFTVTNVGEVVTPALGVSIVGTNAAEFVDASSALANKCAGATLNPLGTCVVKVHLHPTSVGGKLATLTVTGPPQNGATASLAGNAVTAGALTIAPTAYDFGGVITGQSSLDQPFTVTNSGGAPIGPLSTSTAASFVLGADGCKSTTLQPGGSCVINAHFSPTVTGGQSGTLSVSGGGSSSGASLSGNGLQPPSLGASPGSKAFGNVNLGSTSAQSSFTITNSGAAAGAITVTPSGSTGDFLVGNSCTTLGGGGAQCTLTASFKPLTQGGKSLTLTVTGASGGTTTVTLTGYGYDPVTLTIAFAGNGAGYGTVFSTAPASPSINCTTGCSQTYDRGTVVTLSSSASPSAAASLTGWTLTSGTCSGTGTCSVTLGSAVTVTATFTLQKYTLTVTNSHLGTASGTVTGGNGISCGATCSVSFDYGVQVALSEAPTSGGFGGWSGACSGTGPSCNVTITGATSVGATFSPFNKVFVTSTTSTGAFSGLAGGDAICQARATAAGLTGTYRAYLSSSTTDARDRLVKPGTTTPARGWVRTDGLPFADQPSDLATGSTSRVYYPARLGESGTVVDGNVLTGSGSLGLKTTDTCGDWTLTASSGAGGSSYDADRWYYGSFLPCGNPQHLMCFGVDYATVLTPPTLPAGAKRIFTSNGTFTPVATWIQQADATCNSEGRAAYGSTKNFVALLATTTATAASRLTGSIGPWARPDGVTVFNTLADVTAQNLVGAPNQYPGGTFTSQPMWSGATNLNSVGTVQSTCNNWSIADATAGTLGSPSVVGTYFFNDWAGVFACSGANHLVCAEK
jgi:hypothetical protein